MQNIFFKKSWAEGRSCVAMVKASYLHLEFHRQSLSCRGPGGAECGARSPGIHLGPRPVGTPWYNIILVWSSQLLVYRYANTVNMHQTTIYYIHKSIIRWQTVLFHKVSRYIDTGRQKWEKILWELYSTYRVWGKGTRVHRFQYIV